MGVQEPTSWIGASSLAPYFMLPIIQTRTRKSASMEPASKTVSKADSQGLEKIFARYRKPPTTGTTKMEIRSAPWQGGITTAQWDANLTLYIGWRQAGKAVERCPGVHEPSGWLVCSDRPRCLQPDPGNTSPQGFPRGLCEPLVLPGCSPAASPACSQPGSRTRRSGATEKGQESPVG